MKMRIENFGPDHCQYFPYPTDQRADYTIFGSGETAYEAAQQAIEIALCDGSFPDAEHLTIPTEWHDIRNPHPENEDWYVYVRFSAYTTADFDL